MRWDFLAEELARRYSVEHLRTSDGRILTTRRRKPVNFWRLASKAVEKHERDEFKDDILDFLGERCTRLICFGWNGVCISWWTELRLLDVGDGRAYVLWFVEDWPIQKMLQVIAAIEPSTARDAFATFFLSLVRDNGKSYGIDFGFFADLPEETENYRPDLIPEHVVFTAYWDWIQMGHGELGPDAFCEDLAWQLFSFAPEWLRSAIGHNGPCSSHEDLSDKQKSIIFKDFFYLGYTEPLSDPQRVETRHQYWDSRGRSLDKVFNELEQVVKSGEYVRLRNENRWNLLHVAIALNASPDAIRGLAELGVAVNEADKDGRTPLHLAVEAGNASLVRSLVQLGADSNKEDDSGRTPLELAAAEGKIDVIRVMVELGMDINAVIRTLVELEEDEEDKDGWNENEGPLLRRAAKGNRPELIRTLVELGADVNVRSEDGNTLLHQAAAGSNLELIRTLVELGADVDARGKRGETPLHRAAARTGVDVIRTLVELGADLNALDENGATALHWAAEGNDNPEVIYTLVQLGADVNARDKDDETPLYRAATFNSNPEVIRALVQLGADMNVRNRDGETSLHRAAASNEVDVIRTLVELGAEVNARSESGETPLHLAAVWNRVDVIRTIRTLVELGADVNARSKSGETPLHRAAATRGVDVVRTLVELGADVNARSESGKTPLHLAAFWNFNGEHEVIRALVQLGADINVRDDDGWTPLHLVACNNSNGESSPEAIRTLVRLGADINARMDAVVRKPSNRWEAQRMAAFRSRNTKVIHTLVQVGADVNAQDREGVTPLHLAAFWSFDALHLDVIHALVKLGANVDARDKRGWTPLHWAARYSGESRTVLDLLELGADPRARTMDGRTAWDLIQENDVLYNTPAYQKLNDLRF